MLMHAHAYSCMLMHAHAHAHANLTLTTMGCQTCDLNMFHNHSPFGKCIAMLAVGIEVEDIEVENVVADVKK